MRRRSDNVGISKWIWEMRSSNKSCGLIEINNQVCIHCISDLSQSLIVDIPAVQISTTDDNFRHVRTSLSFKLIVVDLTCSLKDWQVRSEMCGIIYPFRLPN